MNIEAKFAEKVDKIQEFEKLNVESTIKDITDEITRMQLQMTNEKAELEQLQRTQWVRVRRGSNRRSPLASRSFRT